MVKDFIKSIITIKNIPSHNIIRFGNGLGKTARFDNIKQVIGLGMSRSNSITTRRLDMTLTENLVTIINDWIRNINFK